jgi:hypothetical protein
MRSFALSLALLTAAATGACLTDQSYTPIGEETEDKLCTQTAANLYSTNTKTLALDGAGRATYSGTSEVSEFSRSSIDVHTEELIIAVPAGSSAGIEIGQGALEYFTSMVFAVDIRRAGGQRWEPIALATPNYDITWFNSIDVDASQYSAVLSTLSLCSTSTIDTTLTDLPSDVLSSDHEIRLRAYPFDGVGDAIGVYDYELTVSVR